METTSAYAAWNVSIDTHDDTLHNTGSTDIASDQL